MLKQKLLILTAALVMTANVSPTFANDYYPSDNCYSACCDTGCCNIGVYGDWLHWRTRRCAMDYAIPAQSGSPPYEGRVQDVSPGWDDGFRVGLVKYGCEYDFGIHYTRFRHDKSNTTKADSGGLVATRLGSQISSTTAANTQFARGKYELDYDVVDLEGSYHLALDNYCARASIFGGFRFAEIDELFDIVYAHNRDDLSGEGVGNAVDKVKTHVDLEAYGLFLGGRVGYDWNRCINLFGSFSYGLLYSNIDRIFHAQGTAGNNVAFTDHAKLKDGCKELISNIDLAFGLRYNVSTRCFGNWYFGLGYEFHQWINLPDFLSYIPGDSTGENHFDHSNDNFGLDGLFLRLGSNF